MTDQATTTPMASVRIVSRPTVAGLATEVSCPAITTTLTHMPTATSWVGTPDLMTLAATIHEATCGFCDVSGVRVQAREHAEQVAASQRYDQVRRYAHEVRN